MPGPILITGASGFVGRYLLKEFADNHPAENVIGYGFGKGSQNSLDLSRDASVSAMLRKHQPRVVIHLAAIAAPTEARAHPDHAWEVNVEGTRKLARAIMAETDRKCRLIFVGSAEAYGSGFNSAGGPVRETEALRPISAYGVTKAAADVLVGQLAHEGLDVCRFRPFNHTGPGQTDAYVVPAFARQVAQVMKGEAPPLIKVGNLDAARDFMDVRDVVKAYALAALDRDGFGLDSVYNLASGKAQTIGSVLDRLIALSGQEIRIEVDPARLRPNDIPLAVGDPSAAKARFGWTATRGIDDIVADVLKSWL
jgi:GDP-4-dehydro-6-deoxy-D-mannose reductase